MLPEFDWQSLLAVGCVMIAAAAILRRTVRLVWGAVSNGSGVTGCGGGCGSCAHSAAQAKGSPASTSPLRERPFVSLETLSAPKPR